MRIFAKMSIVICSFVFILSLTTPAECYWYSGSSGPININLNINGYSGGGFPTTFPFYPLGIPYPRIAPLLPEVYDYEEIQFMHSTTDDEYIYSLFRKDGDQSGLMIFKLTGSDDYEYVSHIILHRGYSSGIDGLAVPEKIIVQDDLVAVGCEHLSVVYLIDISDRDEPVLVNELLLGKQYDVVANNVTGLAIENHVLFASIECLDRDDDENENTLFALDISDPEDTDIDDDLLDSYFIEDYRAYGMVSTPDYLYLTASDEDRKQVILIIDIKDPANLSLAKDYDDLDGEDTYRRGTSIAVDDNYLYATVNTSDSSGGYNSSSSYKLNIIDISDPTEPQFISSSKNLLGQNYEDGCIVIHDHYAYLLANSSKGLKCRMYIFNIADPEGPDLVETSETFTDEGLNLRLVGDRLALFTRQTIKIFDISDPEELSLDITIEGEEVLDDDLDWDDDEHDDFEDYDDFEEYGPFGPYSFPSFLRYSPYENPYGAPFWTPDIAAPYGSYTYGGSGFGFGGDYGFNPYGSPGFGFGPGGYPLGSYGGYSVPYGGYSPRALGRYPGYGPGFEAGYDMFY